MSPKNTQLKAYFAQSPPFDHQQQERLLAQPVASPGYSSGQSSPLKPLHLATDMDHHSGHQHRRSLVDFEEVKRVHDQDAILKSRIRRLRILSRILAFLISVAVLVPIAMTLHKFLSTQHVYRDVPQKDGTVKHRNAWHKDTKAWPTYMYFVVAAISVLLNFIILFSYVFGGVEKANKAAYVATTFTWLTLLGNLVVWSVAAGLYRSERDKGGVQNDLWGWTCSAAAKAIQKEFAQEVDFNQYCNVQSVSWYVGLVQVGAAFLTVVIYIFVLRRRSTKKKLKRHSQLQGQYPTNY